jgi:hypothetical protein
MENNDTMTQSREKYKKQVKLSQKANKRDLRQRLRHKNIQSQINHSISAISPKSKIVFKISKTLAIPQKKLKKKNRGQHGQSTSFSKS